MLKIEKFVFNSFQENTYLVFNEESKNCVIIDPGNYFHHENDALTNFIESKTLKINKVLLTHGHLDHIFGLNYLFENFCKSVYLANEDYIFINIFREQCEMFEIDAEEIKCSEFTFFDGAPIFLDSSIIRVISVPGHSKGGTAFIIPDLKSIFTGDTIFKDGLGRTDLFGGDYDTLIKSIKEKILILPEDYVIYPGHGEQTSISGEIKNFSM